jgi:ribosomal protein L2
MQSKKMTPTSRGKRWKSEKQKETKNKRKSKKSRMEEEQRVNNKMKEQRKERTVRNKGGGKGRLRLICFTEKVNGW